MITRYGQEDSEIFTDEGRLDVWERSRQQGIRAFANQVTPELLVEAAKRTGVRLVKCSLCLVNLVWLGIAAALQRKTDFATVLKTTLKILEDAQGSHHT